MNHVTEQEDVDRAIDFLERTAPVRATPRASAVREVELARSWLRQQVGGEMEAVDPHVLRSLALLSDLSDEDATRVAAIARTLTVPAGAVVIREWDVTRDFFFILAGEVSVTRDGAPVAGAGRGTSSVSWPRGTGVAATGTRGRPRSRQHGRRPARAPRGRARDGDAPLAVARRRRRVGCRATPARVAVAAMDPRLVLRRVGRALGTVFGNRELRRVELAFAAFTPPNGRRGSRCSSTRTAVAARRRRRSSRPSSSCGCDRRADCVDRRRPAPPWTRPARGVRRTVRGLATTAAVLLGDGHAWLAYGTAAVAASAVTITRPTMSALVPSLARVRTS